MRVIIWCVVGLGLLVSGASAAELGFNLYGVSYHLDRRDWFGRPFNELNPGLGLNLIVHQSRRSIWFVEGGSFEDSFRQHARYLSVGYRYRLRSFLSVGMHLGYYHSRSVNYNRPVLAPVPMLSLRYRPVSLNVVYVPSYWGLNWFPAWGAYLTIHVLRFDRRE